MNGIDPAAFESPIAVLSLIAFFLVWTLARGINGKLDRLSARIEAAEKANSRLVNAIDRLSRRLELAYELDVHDDQTLEEIDQ
jgi:hypothetical protein